MLCSEASSVRGEPLAGTAPVATRFLMVEYPGSWPPEPLDVFAPPTRDRLAAANRHVRGQLLLVRRPDGLLLEPARLRDRSHRWWVVDTAARTQVTGTWTTESDLAGAAAALADPGAGRDDPADLTLLVCCHAKRDQCCAIAGRPLAAELRAVWPEQTWQCTHLGGHRFAPTFLVLPDGVNYGRVPAGLGAQVVADHLTGRVHAELLRGHCAYDGWEQAAIADVLREDPGPVTRVTSAVAGDDAWDVAVTVGQARHSRSVRRVAHAPLPLSCGDKPLKRSVSYEAQRV